MSKLSGSSEKPSTTVSEAAEAGVATAIEPTATPVASNAPNHLRIREDFMMFPLLGAAAPDVPTYGAAFFPDNSEISARSPRRCGA